MLAFRGGCRKGPERTLIGDEGECVFSESYEQARGAFSARGISLRTAMRAVGGAQKPGYGRFGPANAGGALNISGTHGAEGYGGLGAQTAGSARWAGALQAFC